MKQLIISPTQCYYAACLRRALAVTRPRASDRDATIGRLPAWSGGHDISSHWQHPSSTSDAVMRATWHSCWFRLGFHVDKPHGNHHASRTDVLGNGITESRSYSNDNLLTAINYSNTSLGDLTYTWDTNENKTSESISGTMSGYGFTQSGTVYDDEDRLTGYARSNSSLTQSWSLTSVGDWSSVTTNGTAQSRTHGPTHELLTAGGQTVNTDVKGNITLLPTALSSLASTALGMSWDFDNKLKSVDVGNNSSTDVEYKYDALGRRVARVGSSGSYVYVQSDQQALADYGVGDAPSSPPYRYVYASYIDEPVVRKAAGTGGTIHYYHRNQQYSISAVTTSAGAIAERYAYSAYGEPTILDSSGSVIASSSINNRYSYTGREWDETVGLYHFRARWMSPKTGRFLTRDPIGTLLTGFHLYAIKIYQDLTDPSGLTQTQVPATSPVGPANGPKPSPQELGWLGRMCDCSEGNKFDSSTTTAGGTVYCDDQGKIKPWVNPNIQVPDPKPGSSGNVGLPDRIKKMTEKCVQAHESYHVAQFESVCPGFCSKVPGKCPVFKPKDDRVGKLICKNASECMPNHYNITCLLEEYKRESATTPFDASELRFMSQKLANHIINLKQYNCPIDPLLVIPPPLDVNPYIDLFTPPTPQPPKR